jgi:hypothetical protein
MPRNRLGEVLHNLIATVGACSAVWSIARLIRAFYRGYAGWELLVIAGALLLILVLWLRLSPWAKRHWVAIASLLIAVAASRMILHGPYPGATDNYRALIGHSLIGDDDELGEFIFCRSRQAAAPCLVSPRNARRHP